MARLWLNKQEQLFAFFLTLLIIGIINVLSSTFVMANEDYGEPYYFLLKHLKALGIGFIAFLLSYFIDYRLWKRLIGILTIVTFAGLLFVLTEPTVNGASRWIFIGSVSIQPSELAKLVAIMIEAYWLSVQTAKKKITIFHRGMFVIFLMAVLVENQPDGATAAIIAGIAIFLYFLSNAPRQAKFILSFFIMLAFVVISYAQPYRLARLKMLLDPFSAEDKEGYQILHSLAAFATGGVSGMGFGRGISKYHYLPEAHTDFAFAILGQEVGFVGVFIVIVLFVAILYTGVRVALHAIDLYGEFLALGITLLLVGQGVVNMLMVSGFFPVVGVPLPFISYGGSSLFVSMFSFGMLLNIAKISEKYRQIRENKNKFSVGSSYTKIHRVK